MVCYIQKYVIILAGIFPLTSPPTKILGGCVPGIPGGVDASGAGARQCATERRGERAREKRNVFSIDLTAVIESLLTVLSVVSSKQPEQSIDNS